MASNKSATVPSISKEFLVSTIEAFKHEMLQEFKKNTSDNAELRTSLSFLSDAVDKNNKIMNDISTEIKKIQTDNLQLKKENVQLQSTVSSLEIRVRNLEQYSRRQNIEIDGIPETQGEDVLNVLENVAKAIEVDLKREKVIAAHRIPSFNKKRTPPIIVRFSTYEERDVWIGGFKKMRPLTLNMVNPVFKSSAKVFINEHLSPENKLLLAKTKESARNKGYKYVWSRDGRIFVRKEDGVKCRRIDSVADIDKL